MQIFYLTTFYSMHYGNGRIVCCWRKKMKEKYITKKLLSKEFRRVNIAELTDFQEPKFFSVFPAAVFDFNV